MQEILNRINNKSLKLAGKIILSIDDNGYYCILIKPVKDKVNTVDIFRLGSGNTYEDVLLSTEKSIDYLLDKLYNININS